MLALLQDEPGADSLKLLLRRAVVSSVNVAEVLAKLVREGVSREAATAAFAALHLEVAPFEPADAEVSAQYVRKGVSLGDRCFLAVSGRYGEGFTSDRQLCEPMSGTPKIHNFRP